MENEFDAEIADGRVLIFDIKGRTFPMKVPSNYIFATVNGKTCTMTVRLPICMR